MREDAGEGRQEDEDCGNKTIWWECERENCKLKDSVIHMDDATKTRCRLKFQHQHHTYCRLLHLEGELHCSQRIER